LVIASAVSLLYLCALHILPEKPEQVTGIWSSRAELALLPMSGPAWEAVYNDAQQDTSHPDVGNQNDNTNCFVLAAAIVSERLLAAGDVEHAQEFRQKVICAIETIVRTGQPAGSRSLAWALEPCVPSTHTLTTQQPWLHLEKHGSRLSTARVLNPSNMEMTCGYLSLLTVPMGVLSQKARTYGAMGKMPDIHM